MFPYGIFFLRCHYCDHYIPLPRLGPLGRYAGDHWSAKGKFEKAWPAEFACMNCQRWWPYAESEIHKLEQEDEGYEALAEQSKESALWQLQVVEVNGPPGDSQMYVVAERDTSPQDLKPELLRTVGPDGKKFKDQREITAAEPKAFYFF